MTDETVESTPFSEIMSGSKPEATEPAKTETPTGDDKTAAPPAAKAEPEVKDDKAVKEPPETPEKLRDDKGRFVPKEEADAIKKALKEERRKRQDLQSQIDSKSKAELPDPFAEPDKYVQTMLSKERAETDNKFFNYSEYHAKKRYTDYDEVVAEFMEDAEADPALARQIFPQVAAHVDPADFLYTQAKQRRELKAVDGDLGKFRESIETPIKTELSEAQKKIAALEAQLKGLSKVSPSMNDELSTTGAKVAEGAAEPLPMDEILTPKKRKAS